MVSLAADRLFTPSLSTPIKFLSMTHTSPKRLPEINVPGIQIVLNRKYGTLRRLGWSLLLITSACVCSYQGVDRLLLFMSSPVEMKARIDQFATIKFPAFTICPFEIDSMPDLRREKVKHGFAVEKENVFKLVDVNVTNERIWQLNSINEKNTKISFEMKKTLPLSSPLSTLTKKSNLAYLGTCMTVVTDNLMDYMGSSMVLSIKQPMEEDVIHRDEPAFTIYAHDDGIPAKHQAFFKGNIILTGQKTSIALSKTKFIYLNRSNYLCKDSVTSAFCWTNCIEERLNENAECRLPYMSKNVSNCTTSITTQATYDATLKVYLETRPEDCKCPKPCDDDIYDLTMDVQGFTKNSTVLELYFQMNTVKVVEEKYSYDVVAFVCDLGGNLGFYLGISLLSLVEITEYFIMWCSCK